MQGLNGSNRFLNMIAGLGDLSNQLEALGAVVSPQVLIHGYKLKLWERIPIAGTEQHMTRTRTLWFNATELEEAVTELRNVSANHFVDTARLTVRLTELPSHRRIRLRITVLIPRLGGGARPCVP